MPLTAASSNTTLLCDVESDGQIVQAVYKPHRGERPLWDFPSGLYRREIACYELAKAIGCDLVPPTVLVDGPVASEEIGDVVEVVLFHGEL